jgi:beta-glucosidase/6-phospho-beta-glucosidase/beta-galactosidase
MLRSTLRLLCPVGLLSTPLLLGCGSGTPATGAGGSTTTTTSSGPADIVFGKFGGSSAPSGKGSFRFGASSAATQIEDQNVSTDWYLWTEPKPMGLGNGTFVGNASDGYTLDLQDIDLLVAMHLDSYRFSIEWARVEPQKGMIDEDALAHYDALITALVQKGIRPMITLHHFSNPVWVDDPSDPTCKNGPSDQNLCGLDDPTGGPMVVQAMADHAALLAARFGDRVDDWATLNEPVNYLLAAYGAGKYPPGKFDIANITTQFMPAVRNYIAAHAAMYDAIKANDTVDADGDGVAASVGFTKEAAEWVAAHAGMPSTAADDVAARERVLWIYQYLFAEAIEQGGFDPGLTGTLTEPHPEWKGKLDWMGVQYYTRAGVTATPPLIPVANLTPCFSGFGAGTACVPPLDPTYVVPVMGYETDPQGLGPILEDFGSRWPGLPLIVTESGIATETGARRAEIEVRALEQIAKAQEAGVDVRGYYHWSIFDNFEWAYGFVPHFGLYTVDYTTYARTPTLGATVLGQIAASRLITGAQRTQYGGSGPLTPETTADGGP